ncbi:Wunen [Operophtera brumata]|uniref:Wunen n=1 Tax=Operophtera brumata TaxID=104452 RepID=A0A0L7LEE7_OPEBR|nr:Wunen [Operophtera brumata]
MDKAKLLWSKTNRWHRGLLLFLLIETKWIPGERAYHPGRTGKPRQALRWYKEYMFGLLVNLIVVQAVKTIVGSPRPHFFDTCSPKEAATCEGKIFLT